MADSSFDIVSSVDLQEVKNAIAQATKVKVQAAIQGDQLRVSGKSKDDLQTVMQVLRETDLGIDMQFTNRR
jgi:hypothetical protein